MVSLETKQEVAEFLYREAHLLDEHRFEEWLTLFTDDLEYLIPLRELVEGDVPPAGHPIIKDDKLMLIARVKKNATGMSHVEIPHSTTTRLVTNVLVEDGVAEHELRVFSSFVVRQVRRQRDSFTWGGRRTDLLRKLEGAWKIARREVLLDETVLPRTLTIFL